VIGQIRLGAVEYLNARPLVWRLEASPRFAVRFDVPARCAELLHANEIDLGLIPSIEYLRGPLPYYIVPGAAVASRGAVASVALYTRREPEDIRSIALDLTSRTSVALTRVVAKRAFHIAPELTAMAPDLPAMLDRADAALIIGDKALLLEDGASGARKIDLGELWREVTGLPFVYAFWAGRRDVASAADVAQLNDARNAALREIPAVAAAYYRGDERLQAIAGSYLRDNIWYSLGPEELAGLETFYRYAAELGLVTFDGRLRFYHAERD
jgi:chorismate dehydratase